MLAALQCYACIAAYKAISNRFYLNIPAGFADMYVEIGKDASIQQKSNILHTMLANKEWILLRDEIGKENNHIRIYTDMEDWLKELLRTTKNMEAFQNGIPVTCHSGDRFDYETYIFENMQYSQLHDVNDFSYMQKRKRWKRCENNLKIFHMCR